MSKSRNPAGRPPSDRPKRDRPLQIMLTAAQREIVERRAAESGLSLSDWARLKLFQDDDQFTRYLAYHESGRAARDEAAEIEEEMAELHRLNGQT